MSVIMNKVIIVFFVLLLKNLESKSEEEQRKFSDGFLIGAASASYQIEGAWNESKIVAGYGSQRFVPYFNYHGTADYLAAHNLIRAHAKVYTLYNKEFRAKQNGHLDAMLNSIHVDGCNVVGYTAWSLTDNFQWLKGYIEHFGIFHVDFEDPERPRTPKQSASFFRSLLTTRMLPALSEEPRKQQCFEVI